VAGKGGIFLKLNYKRTFLVGLAFLSICAFWQMYDNIVPLILQGTFHLNETLTGAIMAADNVLAVFLLPLLGSLSDKADTRWGKRTPFIVVGTVLAVVLMMLLPHADKTGNFVLFVISLFFLLIAMGLYRSPAVALMPDLTPKPLRSQANAIINLMGAVGGIYTLILISLLLKGGDKPDYTPVFLGVALLMVVAVVLLVLTVREKKLAQEVAKANLEEETEEEQKADKTGELTPGVKSSLTMILISIFLWFTAYNAVTTAFSRYARTVWGMEGGGFANCLMVATVEAIISYRHDFREGGQEKDDYGRSDTDVDQLFCGNFLYGISRSYQSWLCPDRNGLGSSECKLPTDGCGDVFE
jgi:maltose/moltooligosaccharide transporter